MGPRVEAMESRMFGSLWPVSPLALGGGGIGQVWGSTSREEAVATVRAAVDGGINLIDVAPSYGDGEAERVIGDALDGRLPDGVRISTKHHVGHDPSNVEAKARRSLEESLTRMGVDSVDVFILHSQIVPAPDPGREAWTTPMRLFNEAARPALQRLVDDGRVGAWGITAVQFPQVLGAVLAEQPRPQVGQMITNIFDAPGDMSWSPEPADHRRLISRANELGMAVMGIRAVQAGALTDQLDRDVPAHNPVARDYERATPIRHIAAELGMSTASLAHRYALTMEGVHTVVLGVKNRAELAESLAAAEAGPLPSDVVTRIDKTILRPD